MTEFSGKIGHLENLESPWGNAGGVVRGINDVERMAQTGVGWIEEGSTTLLPRIGNSPNGENVYFHNSLKGDTYNSLGMPNKGIEAVEKDIPEMSRIARAYRKQLLINVAPVSDQPEEESFELVSRAYAAGADAVLLNAGCPNLVTENGGYHETLSHSPSALRYVLGALAIIEKPIFIRISPQESFDHMRKVCEVIARSGVVSAVFTPNTWPGHKPIHPRTLEYRLEVPGGIGGKSGPSMKDEAALQTTWAAVALWSSKIDVVSSSSIMTGQELHKRIDWGAVAGAGTTFFYESKNGWADDTNRLLSEYADSYSKVRD